MTKMKKSTAMEWTNRQIGEKYTRATKNIISQTNYILVKTIDVFPSRKNFHVTKIKIMLDIFNYHITVEIFTIFK